MESIREIYRIGMGPSSSHTMAPRRAATLFAERTPTAAAYRVTLYASLAATGRGHLTHVAVTQPFAPRPVEIIEQPDITLPFHPNGLRFEALDGQRQPFETWQVYSVGGGALQEDPPTPLPLVYRIERMNDVMAWATDSGNPLWRSAKTTRCGMLSRMSGRRCKPRFSAGWTPKACCPAA